MSYSADSEYSGKGPWDFGKAGLAAFVKKHECNKICKKLKLSPFNLPTCNKRKRVNELEITEPKQLRLGMFIMPASVWIRSIDLIFNLIFLIRRTNILYDI